MKSFVYQVVVPILAAAFGAGLGGLITYHVAINATQTQAKVEAYDSYLREAYRAWAILKHDPKSSFETLIRFLPASSVLWLHASPEVMEASNQFKAALRTGAFDEQAIAFVQLQSAMKREITGQDLTPEEYGAVSLEWIKRRADAKKEKP